MGGDGAAGATRGNFQLRHECTKVCASSTARVLNFKASCPTPPAAPQGKAMSTGVSTSQGLALRKGAPDNGSRVMAGCRSWRLQLPGTGFGAAV